ncbi:MAG: YwiC-like family protein [Blastocatellia bacterium]
MNLRSRLKLPKEHGAWAMLYVPFVLGVAVAGRFSWPLLPLLLAATALFISRESLLIWWRARNRGREANEAGKALLAWLLLAALFGLPLLLVWRLHGLLPLGAIGLALLLFNGRQAARLEERSIAGELVAICGLTMTAPASYHAARGAWDRTALWIWLLSVLYFASSVFYIKLRVYRLNPRKQEAQRRVWRGCAAYHAFLLLALAALFASGSLSVFALIAFTPVLARTFWSLGMPVASVNLKRAGILEIVYSLLFLAFVALGFSAD